MTPEQFLFFADPLPEPMLFLSADGLILAGNRATGERLGVLRRKLVGRQLAEVVGDSPAEIARYLRLCSRSRSMVLGSLDFLNENNDLLPCRAEGSLLRPLANGQEALLLLRLVPKASAVGQFVALNQRIEHLGGEIQRRRQAEEIARQQAERLRVTLSSIGDGVIVTDAGGRITSINPVAATLTGWTSDEAAGLLLEDIFHIINESTRKTVENPAHRALRDGVIVGLANHTILINRDGTERPIADSAAPIQDDTGSTFGVVLVFRDVSEERRAEDEVRFQARLLDAVGQAVIATDSNGRIIFWNPFAETLYGWSKREALGRGIIELVVAPAAQASAHEIMGQLRAEQTWSGELQMIRRDRAVLTTFITNTPVFDDQGALKAIIGVSADITERKRVEQGLQFLADASTALATVEDYRSTLQKVAGLAVPTFADWCAVDIQQSGGSLERLAVVHVDPDKVRLAGELNHKYPPEPSETHGPSWVLQTGEPEFVAEISDELLKEIAKDEVHLNILRSLGLRSFICVPLMTRSKMLGVVTFVYAESGRRYQSGDLILATELARRAAVAIENAMLYHELKETDRRKDEFLATLAHELRNPLAPIRNGLQVMRLSGVGGGMIDEARSMMERQLSQMVRLVDDLLDVSRITRNKLELRKERVSLATVVQCAIETSRPLIEKAEHELSVTLPFTPVHLDADLTRLAQVFSNLLNNAAKYTEPGGRIELTGEVDHNEVVVRVLDNGLGIPADALAPIFEMFLQVEGNLERAQGGLGIGLTLVRRLVEMHGGTVEARSDGPGRGSEFTVRLPVLKLTQHTPITDNGELAVAAEKRRILVVDDNQDSAMSLGMMLKLMGNETHTAHDGLAAVNAAEQFRPDIILLDIGLPKLNGHDACRRIREQAWSKGMVIVALTGWGQEDDRRRSQEAGFDHHLVKPVEIAALEKLLTDARAT